MRTINLYTIALTLIVFISFYGCVSSQKPVPIVISAVPSRTAVASQTPLPTLLPVSTKQRSTKAPPPAPSGLPPTWTPLPTYPADQARQVVMELYENNPCRLPCWWGIAPGKTSWLEAWQFLGRFAKNNYPWETLLLESKRLPGYMYYQVYLDVPQTPEEKINGTLNNLTFIINIKTFTVDYISVDTGNVEAYTLPRILADYGKPQEIYVFGGESPIASEVSLLLYYPQHGFISTQSTVVEHAVWKEPAFTACFQKVTTALSLWAQDDQQMDFYTRLEISRVDSFSMSLIKLLDKVSDSTVNNVYENFINTHQAPCIDFNTEALQSP
jgi:hypothetical protein